MTKDIMIDLTSHPRKRYNTGVCHFCDHSRYPDGKVIDPTTDKNAHMTSKGDWMCGTCSLERLYKMNKLLNRGEDNING
jgi:hypothetical protein